MSDVPDMSEWVFAYPAHIESQDQEGVVLRFNDLAGAVTGGFTRDEALAEAPDCLAAAVAAVIDTGEDLPPPSRPGPNDVMVPVPPRIAAKAALYRAMRENGVGVRELARRLGCTPSEAQRLISPRHGSKIDRLADAVRAAGGPSLELHGRRVA